MQQKRRFLMIAAACSIAVIAASASGADAKRNGSAPLPQGSEPFKIDPARFTTNIDNAWWPMRPGARWVYRETDPAGGKIRVTVTVTNKTRKLANGVEARVVHDAATRRGRLVEVTDDFYSQDSDANIWYLGENTKEYRRNGKVKSTAGSFEAGVNGAQGGIIVPADPVPGLKYREEYYAGQAEDRGEGVSVGEQAQVPFGHFSPALMIKDTNPLEPTHLEYKFYAKGIGPVLAIGVSGSSDREELVEFKRGR